MKRQRPAIDASTPRLHLAALVCEALSADGKFAVLVGGSVVSIYTRELFISDDLDFATYRTASELRPSLERLGFTEFVGNTATHPRAMLYVQFVNAPVAIGEKLNVQPVEWPTPVGRLMLLSPLDCVLDRLASFVHYGDRQCLRQAIEVAHRHGVAVQDVREWMENEPGDSAKKAAQLSEFRERLEARKS